MTVNKSQRAIVTICSGQDFAAARVLLSSLKIHHPEASLFLCLADKIDPKINLGIAEVEILLAEKLVISNFADFAFRYESIEFKAAIKPFAIAWLFEQRNFAEVIYLDPSIELFAPLDPVIGALAGGASFVLTPHLSEPYDSVSTELTGLDSDLSIMQVGIFNLGFIAIKNKPDSLDFLGWWSRRCRYQCLDQKDQGLFLDQKFVDLLPAFSDRVVILRDRSLNLAYWNLNQRNLTYKQNIYCGNTWYVDNEPLIFFNFAGFDPQQPHRLSLETTRFKGNLQPALQALVDHYLAQLSKVADFGGFCPVYGYGRFSNNVAIAKIIRQCYRDLNNQELLKPWQENPFATFGNYLNQPAITANHPLPGLVTNLMSYLWSHRPDLQRVFNLENSDHRLDYCSYFVQNLASEYELDDYFILPVVDTLTKHYLSSVNPQSPDFKVSVIGYLKAETGVGNAARMLAESLREAEVETQGYNVTFNTKARQAQTSIDDLLSSTIDAPIQILNINADQLGLVRRRLKRKTKSAQYLINMPFWELSKFPQQWIANYQGIDEVWAASRFIQTTFQSALRIPVLWMPIAVTLTNFKSRDRSYFGLPSNTFLFHFNFDFSSFATRKNPIAAIKAYRLAFRKSSGVATALVIKTRGYDPEGKNLAKLQAQTADESDIIVLNQEMTYPDTFALMNCCDCYISLHRSEGFGFTPAEAMLLNKPVIATDYSGTKDFINQDTGFPVDYRLVPVQQDDYPCWGNQVWAEPDISHAAWLMTKMVGDETQTRAIAKRGKVKILRDYSPQAIGAKYRQRLAQLSSK